MLFLILAFIPFLADAMLAVLLRDRQLTANYVRYVIALSAGLVISAAFFELLPEANIEANAVFVALGFFIFYLVEKTTMLHACGEEECEAHSLGRLTAIGMASDNVVDGLGIAVAYHINPILGMIIALAVISHEVPQAIASASLLRREGRPRNEVVLLLSFAGAMYPLGAALSLLIPEELYTIIVAFVAGVFLYIGAGDLLMEAHRRFNWRIILSVLLGGAIMFMTGTVLHTV
ncbi:MAG: ZIP family metal transporter [Aigarchaeota archaeon]|nr:ZIP family metal transporter [Candidatus Pelearchaeum maunauluense]